MYFLLLSNFMSQFDFIIVKFILIPITYALIMHYRICLNTQIPFFFKLFKFKEKKLNLSEFYHFSKQENLYKQFLFLNKKKYVHEKN